MLRTLDIVLIAVMTAAAAVTYTIKHGPRTSSKRCASSKPRSSWKKDTIDLLKADWALLTQPNRLRTSGRDLSSSRSASWCRRNRRSSRSRSELPMLKADCRPR